MIEFFMILGIVFLCYIPIYFFLEDQRKESEGYSQMAKTMRAMRDQNPEGFRNTIRPFKDVFKD